MFFCASLASAQAPKVSVQWTLAHPRGFEPVRSWERLPYKLDPAGVYLGVDDRPGWVAAIKIGTRLLCCCDHYAVVQAVSFVKSYCWRDDHEYYKELGAEVCRFTGTSMACATYGHFEGVQRNNEKNFPWTVFQPPPSNLVRHGKYVNTTSWKELRSFWK